VKLNKVNKRIELTVLILAFIASCKVLAHPGGNMITVGNHVLWSYVSPIDDTDHHACVMIWSLGAKPEILLRSKYPASDYMFSVNGDHIYIIEQRYLQQTDTFEIRIFKTRIGGEPVEIWRWFEDKWRIGDGGFFMLSDDEIVFGRYPGIYSLNKGKEPAKYFDFYTSIKKIRKIENNQILLLGENGCWLVNRNGKIIRQWNDLIDPKIDNAPLNRNQIFDADYKNGELLLAYWGKRTFEIINNKGIKKTIMLLREPLVPHWVAFYGDDKLLFSSKMIFDGSTPKPNLVLYKSDNENRSIWKD